MSSPQKQYTQELFNKWGYMATWLPGVPIQLGDIGTYHKGQFERITSLKNLGIPFRVMKGAVIDQDNYMSQGAVSEIFKAKGEASELAKYLSEAEAGFIVEMSRANATLFKAKGLRTFRIDDLQTLGDQILDLYRSGNWDRKHFVVIETRDAESATILISSSANAKIELSATGRISPAGVNIADMDAGLQTQYTRDMHTQIIATAGLTPLFKAWSVKKPVFGNAFFRDAEVSVAELTPDEIEYEE